MPSRTTKAVKQVDPCTTLRTQTALRAVQRRDFVKSLSAAATAALMTGAPRSLLGSDKVEHPKPTADRVHIAMDGGRYGRA